MDSNRLIKQLKEDVIKNDLKVKTLIKEILDCNTSSEDLNYVNSLVAKQMREHKRAVDELIKVSKEVTNVSAKQSLETEIDGYRNQIETNSISLRKAIASSQKLITSKTREQLFNTDSDRMLLRQRTGISAVNKEILADKSSAITDNLQTVSRLLASQVTQSEQTLQSLISSSATVTETQEEFKTMGNLIVYSRRLLTKYGRREITDKVLIILALAFFFACVLYVMTKRLLWR